VKRILIVNADDFGRSHAINRGIALAHDRGIVTSASAMVRWPTAGDAAEIARKRPALSVWLHIDLGEWAYAGGEWRPAYEVTEDEPESVAAEIESQLARFSALFGRPPTHLDSHQHVHRDEPVRAIVLDLGHRLGVPVRHFAPGVVYRGDFYGQTPRGEPFPDAISAESLLRLLSTLTPGVTELGCHPASGPEQTSSYAAERLHELEALCDPRVRTAVQAEGIQLGSFDGSFGSSLGNSAGGWPSDS
jgi:predicted glycoside hydrolase/deacetylase ChbG (UPF0249 family)